MKTGDNVNHTKKIAEQINKYLKDANRQYSYDRDYEIFYYPCPELIAGAPEPPFCFVAVVEGGFFIQIDIPVPDSINEQVIASMAKYLCFTNTDIIDGKFIMRPSGKVAFNGFCNCAGTVPSLEMIEYSIVNAESKVAYYYLRIIQISRNEISVEDARDYSPFE